ncbi:MAG: hypothetical protein JW791_01580 [Nanoarchaeota archaeon]|nr:hypothetical protein [Nanoarchaeota archaeon]
MSDVVFFYNCTYCKLEHKKRILLSDFNEILSLGRNSYEISIVPDCDKEKQVNLYFNSKECLRQGLATILE